MRWTQFFIPTLKETPADALVPSHRLMLRAGLIRQVAAGSYAYLPLGYRVLRKAERIVREEMNLAGAIELYMPAMQPLELWQETKRDEAMGPVLIRLQDQSWRKGTVLGPTHEEVITDIARAFVKSYKQVPINLYQIQVKFRDEERPKSGVLRTREFLMKDAYSFDRDKAGLDASYDKMYQAYCRIFDRCGLGYIVVEAESGAIGGDVSHEFMVPTDAGEDMLVQCPSCGYAANLERAACAAPQANTASDQTPPLETIHTPNMRTIDEVCDFLKRRPEQMIKTLVFTGDDGKALVALVRGDHDINENKLARAAGLAEVELADAATIEKLTGAAVGFAGPQELQQRGARIICDRNVAAMHDAASGANKTDYHVTSVEPGRDFELQEVADIRAVVAGDRCPHCQGELAFKKCIEIGHVFKLGTKYSAAMGANYLDEGGKSHPMVMGCYGIGVNRIVAAAIESSHDEDGIIWPMGLAPFHVEVVAIDAGDAEVMAVAERLQSDLEAAGIEVLLDDRPARPGPKFKDADLIGLPLRITVGKRALKEGVVELKQRGDTEVIKLPPDEMVGQVAQRVSQALG